MNDWQILRQVAYLVRAATWGGSEYLFRPDSVIVSTNTVEAVAAGLSLPGCVLAPDGPQTDPEFGEEPGLLVQPIKLTVIVALPADTFGGAALMGANRSALAAAGKGLLEIAVPLTAAIRRLNDASGVHLQSVRKSASGSELVPSMGYVAYHEHRLECVCTDAKSFPKPTAFVATGGSGQVAMTWHALPDRFDRRRFILRRASGSTPPASATVGTGIPLGGSPDGRSAVSVTDSGLSAGTYSYSLFAAYDDYTVDPATMRDDPIGTGSSDKDFSAAATRAAVVVT